MIASRLIPQENFESSAGRIHLSQFLSAAPGVVILFAPPTIYNSTGSDTSVTPAWRNSLWHVRYKHFSRRLSTLIESFLKIASMYPWNYNIALDDVNKAFGTMHALNQGLKAIAPNREPIPSVVSLTVVLFIRFDVFFRTKLTISSPITRVICCTSPFRRLQFSSQNPSGATITPH